MNTDKPGMLTVLLPQPRRPRACVEAPRSASGFRLMNSVPRLTDALQPEAPTDEPTPATAGSARTIASACCCRSTMVWNETSVEARVPPKISPVSSCGK